MRISHRTATATAGLAAAALALTGAAPGSAAASPAAAPTLTSIRAAHHTGYDRIVFGFTSDRLASHNTAYVARLIADPSGKVIPIRGRAILRIVFTPAAAHNSKGRPTSPTSITFSLPEIKQVKKAGDFEGYVSYGIGLAKHEPYTVHILAGRVYLDIRTP